MLAVASRSRSYPVLLPQAAHPGHRPMRHRHKATVLRRAVTLAMLLVLPAIAYVNQSTKAARSGYAILALRQEIDTLQAENQRLVARVTALRAPDRIERIAVKNLGLVKPQRRQLAAISLPAQAAIVPPAQSAGLWRLWAVLFSREAAASEAR